MKPVSSEMPFSVVGSITRDSGNVLYSNVSGFVPGKLGAKLSISTELTTGPATSAGISVGTSCNVAFGPNKLASII